MLDFLRSIKDTVTKTKKKQPPPQTAAEKEAHAASLVQEVAALPKGKHKRKKKREKEKEAARQKLVTAVTLTEEAMAQRPAEVSAAATAKTKAVQAQIDEVKGIMNDNIRKMLERGEKLESVTEKSEALLEESSGFQKSSKTLHRDFAVENLLLTFILIGLAVGLLAGGYFCLFYGMINKYAIPILATSSACGGAGGLLLGIIVKKLYTLFKDSPLGNAGAIKKKVKSADAVLDKATPGISYEQTLTQGQENALHTLLEAQMHVKPVLSFGVMQRQDASFSPTPQFTKEEPRENVRFCH